jgi:hypothetical protein
MLFIRTFSTYVSVTHTRIRFRYPRTCLKGNESVTQEIEAEMSGEPITAGFLCLSPIDLLSVGLG